MEDQGIAKIKLAVNSEQQAAIKLYKKFGFEIVGKLEKELFVDGQYYDELMMERHLR
jgi:RimJ/RimL family protein N-acetyltransferase